MGMDVSGKDPTIQNDISHYSTYHKLSVLSYKERETAFKDNDDVRDTYWEEADKFNSDNPGIYFRNNVWWWKPLWRYCAEVDKDNLISEDTYHGGMHNDGVGLDSESARKLGIKLQVEVLNGNTLAYKEAYEERLAALPLETCHRCNNNNRGKAKKKDCNTCDKTGFQSDFATNYPFDVENVQLFIDFLMDSGGFEIW